jgi:hypothetical protein
MEIVLARPADRERIDAAAALLGVPHDAHLVESRDHLHPYAHVDGERVSVLAFVANDLRKPEAVELVAAPRGLLVIAEEPTLEIVRREVAPSSEDGRVALAAVLVRLGRATGEALDELAGTVRDVAARAMSFASAPERGELTELRASVFILQQLSAAQKYLLGPDEDLAQSLPAEACRPLRKARAAFADAEATATRLHATAGDVLSQQSALVNERLTLVATIFLPLTLSTSFFGMNFGWMTARIGTAGAFFGLGVVFPVLVMVGTVMLMGRLTRRGQPRCGTSKKRPADTVCYRARYRVDR